MSSKYKQPNIAGATRFSKSPMADVEFSRMISTPAKYTSFNAGDIIPVQCVEVLPHTSFEVTSDFVTRLASASIKPVMGTLQMDIYAYFVQNRVVNESWKNLQGENTSGAWVAPEIELAPLLALNRNTDVQIPVGSIADYYGLPTQRPIKAVHLHEMHDLKFRGFLEIYNQYFRDQNYQPPIGYSKLNIYNGFIEPVGTSIVPDAASAYGFAITTENSNGPDGSYPNGAIEKSIFGEGEYFVNSNTYVSVSPRVTNFSALGKPLKANKLHDFVTSGLPKPQKGPEVYFGVADTAPVTLNTETGLPSLFPSGIPLSLALKDDTNSNPAQGWGDLKVEMSGGPANNDVFATPGTLEQSASKYYALGTNLTGTAQLSEATGISVNDLRMAIATQQIYEILARGGSRYRSLLRSLFEIDAESPFEDIPEELGHARVELDMYQVAQTSASVQGQTAQGDLAAFGYTTGNKSLFKKTFLEHGYVHIFAVVRHKNLYSTYVSPDWFRTRTLDYYTPPLANIGEQPVPLRTLNPFKTDEENSTICFQEAWWDYRYQQDECSGLMRTGIPNSLDVWHYGDDFDPDFTVVNGEWLKSNTQEVLDRTLSVTSEISHQFIAKFVFRYNKQLPMPTYSVPGLDTI